MGRKFSTSLAILKDLNENRKKFAIFSVFLLTNGHLV